MGKKVIIKKVKSSKCGVSVDFKAESQKGKAREGKGPTNRGSRADEKM